jgi:hypothetical protein
MKYEIVAFLFEVEGPSYDWLETPKGQRSQSACKQEDYLNNKVK